MKGVDAKVMAKMVITQLPLKCPAEASVVGAIYKKCIGEMVTRFRYLK